MAQHYKNHRRYTPSYHFVLLPLALIGLVLAFTGTWATIDQRWVYVLIFGLFLLTAYCLRSFALKVQDRVVRAEESLRFYILTGKPLPAGLKLPQLLALRFAADEEFVDLAARALAEGLTADQIKRSIRNWREDRLRA